MIDKDNSKREEFNNQIPEVNKHPEEFRAKEVTNRKECIANGEYNSAPVEKPQAIKRKKTNINSVMNMFVVAVVAVVTVGATIFFMPPKVKMLNHFVGGSYAAFDFAIENTSGFDLTFKIYNDYFTHEEKIVQNDDNKYKGSAQNLKPNTNYKVEVKGTNGLGTTTYFSDNFKTSNSESEYVSSIKANFKIKPDDKNLYYKLAIDNIFGYYTEFKFGLSKDGVNILTKLDVTSDLEQEQIINNELLFSDAIFIITAKTTDPKDTEQNIFEKTVYKAKIQIFN